MNHSPKFYPTHLEPYYPIQFLKDRMFLINEKVYVFDKPNGDEEFDSYLYNNKKDLTDLSMSILMTDKPFLNCIFGQHKKLMDDKLNGLIY